MIIRVNSIKKICWVFTLLWHPLRCPEMPVKTLWRLPWEDDSRKLPWGTQKATGMHS